jgi:hypothetical protein
MSYSSKINLLKELEEQKSHLLEEISELYFKLISEEDTASGPKAENEPDKVKMVDDKKPKRWTGQYPPGTKVPSYNGYFITHADGSFDGPYHGD